MTNQDPMMALLERIAERQEDLFALVLTGAAPQRDYPAAPEQLAASFDEPPVEGNTTWDASPDALANYDAAQLVAFRRDHRADQHDPAGCEPCAILERRLGGL